MILLTAFNAFESSPTNASEILLRALPDDPNVVRVVLRTEFVAAGDEIVRLIRRLNPQAVICTGVADGEAAVRLERVARNWDESRAVDNAGTSRNGDFIVPGGVGSYLSTLPYDSITAAFRESNIPYRFSDDAGGFVCNHVFFRACYEIAESGSQLPCGFIHVPPITGRIEFVMLREAIKTCIDVTVLHIT